MASAVPSPSVQAGAAPPKGAPAPPSGESELLRLVFTDDLTGLYNRRFFSKYLKQDADWSEGAPQIALCIMDLDYLKRINDHPKLGHLAGDRVLRRIGAVMRDGAGEGNLPVRYAGDEFALILPGKSREEAIEVAERLRLLVQNDPFEEAGLPDGMHPTLSVGVACFPHDAKGGEELVDRADKALYYSKRTGKNRVTSATAAEGRGEIADLDALAGFPSKTVFGRDEAFRALGESVDIAVSGTNAFVLVEGPPGIGKTRFLSELPRYAKERDLVCLLEKCTPVGREDAYKAISGLLERYFRAEPHALAVVAKALDPEKRAALGEIVPAVREHETAAQAASAAAAIKAAVGATPVPSLGKERPATKRSTAAALEALTRLARPVSSAKTDGKTDGKTDETKLPPPPPPPAAPTPATGSATQPSPQPTPPKQGSGVQRFGKPGGPPPPPPPTTTASAAPPPANAQTTGLGSGQYAVGREKTATGKLAGSPPTPTTGFPRQTAARKSEPQQKTSTPEKGSLARRGPEASPDQDSLPPPPPPGPPLPPPGPPPPPPPPSPELVVDLVDETPEEAEKRAQRGHSISVFTAVCEALVALSVAKPVLVIFDDLDNADEATLEVMARTLPREGRILFCGSARRDRSREEDAPFDAFRESLSQHANVTTLELAPLDAEATAELATSLLQGFRPPPALLERLSSLSKGNPLFLEGALRHLVATGVLVRDQGAFKMAKEIPEAIPVTLEDLVRGQLSVLDKETADAIADAAVIGPNFDFQVLKSVGGKQRSEGEALDLVEAARRARLVRDTGGGEFEFTSSVVADVTYKGLSEERKQTTHRRVAELVEKSQGSAASAASLAFHYRRAGDKEKAERFEAALRARCESIFDRDAIEQLDDVKPPRIPEVVTPPLASLWPLIPPLARALVQAAKTVRPGPDGAKQVDERDFEACSAALLGCFDASPSFTISHRGNSLVLNGEHTHALLGEGEIAAAIAELYRLGSIKSITFLKGPSVEEVQNELRAVLGELGGRTVQAPLERHFWWRFCLEKDLRRICVQQKVLALKRRPRKPRARGTVRIAEQDLPRVRELVWNFSAAIDAVRKEPPGSAKIADASAALDRTLRQLLAQVPAVAINETEDGLVINGTTVAVKVLGRGAPELLRLLRETKLRGFCLLSEISPQELARFVERVARIGPKDVEGSRDPGQEISADGTFPNVLVGDAMFKMAAAALRPASDAPSDEDGEADDGEAAQEAAEAALEAEAGAAPGTPHGFEWPSDAVAKKAKELVSQDAKIVVAQQKAELVQTLESLLLDGREILARKLAEHLALAFTSSETLDRRRAADLFVEFARKGSAELRNRFVRAAVRRLADALEIETDVDVFEQLARAARFGAIERIGEGDFDIAARLVWGVARRREATSATNLALQRIARDTFSELLRDPRSERLFEAIETGSTQDRRRAARVLEGMGAAATGKLVEALKRTSRGRVETFLIDMLAALAPDSEQALLKEVTPYAPPVAVQRLLRGASVVCRDPTPVLVAALQSPDPQVRIEAVSVAKSLGGAIALAVLKWAVRHGSVEAKLSAVTGLGELARGDAADDVLELLQNAQTIEVQRECCLALGKLQAERGVPVLTALLRPGSLFRKEEHEDVRHAAAWALGQMRQNEEARRALERALDDKSNRVQLAAKLFLAGRA